MANTARVLAMSIFYVLRKFEDIRRSASRAMKWAKDFRMDAPWSQFGENTNNPRMPFYLTVASAFASDSR